MNRPLTPDMAIQLASLSLYLAVILWGSLAWVDIRHSTHQRAVKYVASGLIALSMMTAVIFIVAQIPWIVEQHWRVMSLAETLAWLLYDWLNGPGGALLPVSARGRWVPLASAPASLALVLGVPRLFLGVAPPSRPVLPGVFACHFISIGYSYSHKI